MGGECSMQLSNEKCMQNSSRKPDGKMAHLGTEGRILKLNLNRFGS
jgi:hypothetical protein